MVKSVKIKNLIIGGGNKIAVQSMSIKRLSDVRGAVEDCLRLKSAGCDILRFSVLDEKDALSLKEIKKRVDIPIVCDIHFDYKLALKCIDCGADKIRINPGNIGGLDKVEEVARAVKSANIPIRVGANTGSIEKEFLRKFGKNEVSLGESALREVSVLEKFGVENIVVSVKASDVPLMIRANEYIRARCDYPLHIGVTEAGTKFDGIIKNSIGIGSLLYKGVGDTIRVSLSDDPVNEVYAGLSILKAIGKIDDLVEVVACPTCGRCEWNCMEFANLVKEKVKGIRQNLKIAVMGCAVNGPGEAVDADLGIAGAGGNSCVIFKGGKTVRKIDGEKAKEVFFGEIDKCLNK